MSRPRQLTYLARVTDAGEIKAPKRMRAEIVAAFRGKEIATRYAIDGPGLIIDILFLHIKIH